MKNPDNGKIMFKIKIDATKSNIVDLSGNKLKSDYLSQVLEHQDDTIVNLLSFDYTKLNDSDGEIKLVSSSDLITVDGSNQVSGLKLSYNGVEVVIPKSDFILQDDKITIKATIKPFELFTVTGNSIEFIVTFTPGVDLTTSRNLSLANLATTKTFTHEDKVKPRVVAMRASEDNNRLYITFSEEIKRSDFNDFTEIYYEGRRGITSLYDNYKMNIDYFPELDTATYELSEDKKTLILYLNYRELMEYFIYEHNSDPYLDRPPTMYFWIMSADGKLTDTQGNVVETFYDNYDLPVEYNLLKGMINPEDAYVDYRTHATNASMVGIDLSVWGKTNAYRGYVPSLGGDGTTMEGFYLLGENDNRYPLNKTHLRDIYSNTISLDYIKPMEVMDGAIPDETTRKLKFKIGYDPTIGNLVSQYKTPYEPFLANSFYEFDCGPKPEIVDWKIESLDRIPDPSGVRDHISTDKITLTFNKVIKTIENINNIGEDISVTFKKEGSENETNFKTLTSLNVLPNLNLNETIENVEINGKEVSFNVDLAQLAFHSNDIDAGDIAELPTQIRRLKYTKNKTKIIDDFNETIGNYETTVGDTAKYTTLTRTPGNLTSCTYNQIDDNTGEFVLNFDDYITSFDYTKLKLDMNNTGYTSGIEFVEDVFVPDFNSKTQRVFIKTKEVFDKNGIGTTGIKAFKLCFPIELVEFSYMYRLPSPNTPDRNYYYNIKHDFKFTIRPRVTGFSVSDKNELVINFSKPMILLPEHNTFEFIKLIDFNGHDMFKYNQTITDSLFNGYYNFLSGEFSHIFPDPSTYMDFCKVELSTDEKSFIITSPPYTYFEKLLQETDRFMPVNKPVELTYMFDPNVNITDKDNEPVLYYISPTPTVYNLPMGTFHTKLYVLNDNGINLETGILVFGIMNRGDGHLPHVDGDGTILNGFYLLTENGNKYPLDRSHLKHANYGRNNFAVFDFEPRKVLHDVTPVVENGNNVLKFKLCYDSSIGNFISQYDTPFEDLESELYSFTCV